MKVSEMVETLKTLPQDLEVFGPAEDSDYDYQPVMKVFVEKSALIDDGDMIDEPEPVDICVIAVRE
jgi:hypothetical protein